VHAACAGSAEEGAPAESGIAAVSLADSAGGSSSGSSAEGDTAQQETAMMGDEQAATSGDFRRQSRGVCTEKQSKVCPFTVRQSWRLEAELM
jgi:hypothetical protein